MIYCQNCGAECYQADCRSCGHSSVTGKFLSSAQAVGSAGTYQLILDLRNALAAAMRAITMYEGGVDAFLDEAHRAGIEDGIGVRVDAWLKNNPPNEPIRRQKGE